MNKIVESLLPLAIKVSAVKPDPRNARKHNDRNLETIKNSLETYGQRKPIICNKKTKLIEAGNGLWLAAKELGWTEIAAVFVDDDDQLARAYSLMDNQAALLSEWNLPLLKDTLEQLDTGACDMSITGFTADEIEELMTQYYAPVSIDDLLKEVDIAKAIDMPIWIVARTSADKQELLEEALAIIEQGGIRVERSYEV